MRQRDVAALDAKYTKELADAKAENDALRDDGRWSSVGCTSKQSVSQCVKPPPPPAWIMQPPPDWQTPLNDYSLTSERGWSLCKNNWKEPRSILMSSADRVAHIDKQLMQLLWAIHTRFQRECVMPKKKVKTEQSIYECLLACFNNIFCAATNFGCIDSFLLPNRKQEMMGDVFLWCYCCRFVLNSKRLLSTSCNKQGQRSSEWHFFHGVIPDAFWSSQNRMCRKLNKP